MNQALVNSMLTLGNASSGFSASTIMESAMNSASTEAFAVLAVAVPVVAGVVAASAAAKLGFKWLRNISHG